MGRPTTGGSGQMAPTSKVSQSGSSQGHPPQRGKENSADSTTGAGTGLRSWSGIAGNTWNRIVEKRLNFVSYIPRSVIFSVAGAGRNKGIVDQSSPSFGDEFPTLAAGAVEEKNGEGVTRKAADSREALYGPGPSLRPQSKC